MAQEESEEYKAEEARTETWEGGRACTTSPLITEGKREREREREIGVGVGTLFSVHVWLRMWVHKTESCEDILRSKA